MPITLTDRAVSKIKEIVAQDPSLADKSLRIYIEKGGCSGFSYGFKFDTATSADTQQDFETFKLLIDPQSQQMIEGSTIDYREEFGKEGFAIQNPKAKKSCGCGNSFEA